MNKILNDIMILLEVNDVKTSSCELADMLWLGTIMDNNAIVNEKKKEREPIKEQEDSTDKEESSDIDSNSGGDRDSENIEDNNSVEEDNGAGDLKDDKQEPSTTHNPLHLDNGGQESSSPSLSKGEYRKIPTPRHYTQYNQFATVLKILRQQSYSLTDEVLDEDATVEYIANTQIWNVVTKPKQELKFTLNIIIEKSESMMVWEEMTKDFVSAVSGFIFFKNLKVYYLEESEKEFQLYSDKKCQSKVSVNVFHSLEQRNLTMLMSDCISQPWSDERGYKFLQNITQLTPFMILNMLPQRIWKRTILDDTWRIKFTHKKGWLNQKLISDIDEDACKVDENHIKVPMTTFDTISLKHWSNLIVGKKKNWLYGSLFEAKWFNHPPQTIKESQEEEDAVELVRDFEIFASPMAQKLAIYFSTVPLSLDIMKIVQKVSLPESTHTHLAEVFLSGLLKKTANRTKSEKVIYEFVDGVREVLKEKLYLHKKIDVLKENSSFIAKELDSTIDFLALMENPNSVDGVEIGENDRVFAEMIADVFDEMGGEYGEVVKQKEEELLGINNFMPTKKYFTNQEIEDKINIAIQNLNFQENNQRLAKIIKERVLLSMLEYNKLVGINNDVLNDYINFPPNGILPQYTKEILSYLSLDTGMSREINILRYSGIEEIKIRYKDADSVIKKLVKIGFTNIDELKNPLKVFLRGGTLHDLIGIQFLCAYKYQTKWLARALYNFFYISNQTDDHQLYGFYNVARESGYKGLHCDKAYWYPSFDKKFIEQTNTSYSINDMQKILDNKETVEDNLLVKYHNVFNIEIQIHTVLQSTWAKMEYETNYDILEKGVEKNKEISVQWKMLSDNLTNIEKQFELLNSKTEESIYKDNKEYKLFPTILKNEKETLNIFNKSIEILSILERDLKNHEISRKDYVNRLIQEIKYLENYLENNFKLDKSAIFIIKSQVAYIYYTFSNFKKYFNTQDIRNFLDNSVKYYNKIIHDLSHNSEYKSVVAKDLIIINAVVKYGRLTQKHGLGLINMSIINQNDLPNDINKQIINRDNGMQYIGYGIYALINLSDENYLILKNDKLIFFKTIHYLDKLIRDIELSHSENLIIRGLNGKDFVLGDLIQNFRKKYMNQKLVNSFTTELDKGTIKNPSLIVGFLSTLIINKLEEPVRILERIVKLSHYNTIKASDIFLYEYASYMFTYEYRCQEISDCTSIKKVDKNRIEHYGKYYYENMINLLLRIKKEEDRYEFLKARTYFNEIKGRDNFKE